MIRRFIDIGIAVRDLDSAVERYSQVLSIRPRMLGPDHYVYPGLKGARFYLGNATISLVASEDADSPIAKFISTRGEGINHISLEVTDLEQDMKDFTEKGMAFLSRKPLSFPEGKAVFAHPKSTHGVQIAFVEADQGIDLLSW
jgi:methylmalonyl-CoA epimerase